MKLAALLTACLLSLTGSQDAAWEAAWNELTRLQTLERESAEGQELAARLLDLCQRRAREPRATLLEARIDRWASEEPGAPGEAATRLAGIPAREFSARECWLAIEVLPADSARVAVVLRALASTPELTREQAQLAYEVALEEALALRLDRGARPIQEVLQARFQAAWSAANLSLTHHRLGHAEVADAILAEAITREEAAQRPTADLWSRRGVAAFGNGDESEARHYLGRALAAGSADGTLMLGLIDLLGGHLEAARMGFRTSILSDQPAAWALRGWGLTLLPDQVLIPTRP